MLINRYISAACAARFLILHRSVLALRPSQQSSCVRAEQGYTVLASSSTNGRYDMRQRYMCVCASLNLCTLRNHISSNNISYIDISTSGCILSDDVSYAPLRVNKLTREIHRMSRLYHEYGKYYYYIMGITYLILKGCKNKMPTIIWFSDPKSSNSIE